jgi:hypothetical protein
MLNKLKAGWINEVMRFYAGTPTITSGITYNDTAKALADW